MVYNGCNYLSMLGLKLNHVSKRGHSRHIDDKIWLTWRVQLDMVYGQNTHAQRIYAFFTPWLRCQSITWISVDFSLLRSCGIHFRAISQWLPKHLFLYHKFENSSFEITVTFPGTNELKWDLVVPPVLMNYHDHFYVSGWRDLMIYRKHSWDPKLFPSSGEF